MAKSMAREKRPQKLDTEDHVTERVLEATAWAEQHRRAVVIGGIALVAVVAAGFYYRDYREKLVEQASVRFQELQLSAQSADVETIRSELGLFIDQYGGTIYANQARVVLAELELRRDSLRAAIQAVEPVADLSSGSPLAFTAAQMIAATYEQGGDDDRALEWYGRIASEARFDYQRRSAMSEQARLYTAAGQYPRAISLYERLIDETDANAAGQQLLRVRLGEVRALLATGSAPPEAVPGVQGFVPGTNVGSSDTTEVESAVDGEPAAASGDHPTN